jgi:RHS repeat-associated protein
VVQLLPGFSTVDANGQSRLFQTSVVGGSNAPSGESVVITTRSDYELGASGNLLSLHTVDNFGRDEREYHHEFGYVSASGERTLFARDMLGSTRAVLKNGTMVEWNDYYAYGAVRDSWSLANGRWKYIGKELDNETNSLDFGARHFDALVGIWNSVDPLWAKYPALSPYTYAAQNPTSAYDPDGRLVIFINGNHYGDGGSSLYWLDKLDNGEYVAFDNLIMKHFGDYNTRYVDGALGGWAPSNWNRLSNDLRKEEGLKQGLEDAGRILSGLEHDKDGNIIESIKVVTHSMGAAYAKGYIAGIKEYAQKQKVNGLQIIEADFAPLKPLEQSAVDGVPTFQFSNEDDGVASNSWPPFFSTPGKISGVKDSRYFNEKEKGRGHSLNFFLDKVKNLPAGKYKVVDGEIIKDEN